ncbi:MAG: hypothetical protein IIU19_02785 [Oscillospiraceae bacterium]|nr:hypothetical protein [Oscillospiraceae bacterium]
MRKNLCIFLCLLLVFLLVSCGKAKAPEHPFDGDDGRENKEPDIPQDGTAGTKEDITYSYRVAYVNWTEDPVMTHRCINGEFFIYSDRPRLPLYRITSSAELEEFKKTVEGVLELRRGYNEFQSFEEQTSKYDELFFREDDLLMAYVAASSGSFRFGVTDIAAEEGVLRMHVVQTNDPEVYDSAMAGWLVIAEVRKADTSKFEKFDAVRDPHDGEYGTLPGMIEYGSFSYSELMERIDLASSSVRTDGFVNTDEVQDFHPVERAKAEVTSDYDLIQYFRDDEEDVWMVRFFSSMRKGGDTYVYLDGKGVTLLVAYGD